MKEILNHTELQSQIKSLAVLLLNQYPHLDEVVFIGIQQGGVVLADEVITSLQQMVPNQKIQYGQLDITFYRDDIRDELHVANKTEIPFSIEGKDVVLVDDMIDTGGTLCSAASMVMDKGANSVRAFCTHAVLSGKAYENIEKSMLTELIVTDTLPLTQESKKIKALSVAKLFAQAIRNTHEHKSINSLFITPSV